MKKRESFLTKMRFLVMYKQEVLTMKWQGAVSCWSSVRWHLTTTPNLTALSLSDLFLSFLFFLFIFLLCLIHISKLSLRIWNELSNLCLYFLSMRDNQFYLSCVIPPLHFLSNKTPLVFYLKRNAHFIFISLSDILYVCLICLIS